MHCSGPPHAAGGGRTRLRRPASSAACQTPTAGRSASRHGLLARRPHRRGQWQTPSLRAPTVALAVPAALPGGRSRPTASRPTSARRPPGRPPTKQKKCSAWGDQSHTAGSDRETSSRQQPATVVRGRDRPHDIWSAATRAPWRPWRTGPPGRRPDQRVLRLLDNEPPGQHGGRVAHGLPSCQHEGRAARLPRLRRHRPQTAALIPTSLGHVYKIILNVAT